MKFNFERGHREADGVVRDRNTLWTIHCLDLAIMSVQREIARGPIGKKVV